MDSEHEQDLQEKNVFINGREVKIREKELTFAQVVALSGMPTGPEIVFTISYRKGHGEKPEGSMVEGGAPVKVMKGMVFNVSSTNRS
jgi:hypothetical protein